jgi:hypothetical protein
VTHFDIWPGRGRETLQDLSSFRQQLDQRLACFVAGVDRLVKTLLQQFIVAIRYDRLRDETVGAALGAGCALAETSTEYFDGSVRFPKPII